jgi:PAS domain S-box-containing protein
MSPHKVTKGQILQELATLREQITTLERTTSGESPDYRAPAKSRREIVKPNVSAEHLAGWQGVVDSLAGALEVPSALVTTADTTHLEVLVASSSAENPFKRGDREKLKTGLYCETVMEHRAPLLVRDARREPGWEESPDLEAGLIFYLGFPLCWPDGDLFGTICVLDRRENQRAVSCARIVEAFAKVAEAQLGSLVEVAGRERTLAELRAACNRLKTKVNEHTAALDNALAALKEEINERRRTEEELRKSEIRYRTIIENQTEFVVRWLPDGTRTFVNDAYCRYFGGSQDEIIGKSFFPLIDEVDRERVARRIASATPEAPCSSGEHRVIRPDGSVTWNEWVDRAIFDESGCLVEFQSVGRDIGERKLAEETLKRSEQKYREREAFYRAVFESLESGLVIGSLEDGRLLVVNQAVADLHGYTVQEAEGLPPDLFVHPDSLGTFKQMQDAIRRGERFHLLGRGLRKDGSTVEIEGHAVPFDYKGQKAFLAALRNVTEQKKLEEAKEAAFLQVARLKDALLRERDYLREEVDLSHHFGEIVGRNPALRRVMAQIESVAATSATTLILGESGAGKELIARAIHARSGRSTGPLVKVNCASIPRDLFESEFFGHVKGAFTGARHDRVGRFQLADRGTIFLDEVGDIPLELQGKLLRVLQEGEFERVGEDQTRKIDVRVIAATNRDLAAEVRASRFREDLYYRLSVFPIEIPPLRERREDIVPLALHFLEIVCGDLGRKKPALSIHQAEALRGYRWPGNARELRNVIERGVILSPGDRLRIDLALPRNGEIAEAAPDSPEGDEISAVFVTAAELRRRERENIIAALDHTRWRISGEGGAASLLGLKPTTLSYKMKSMGIRRPH